MKRNLPILFVMLLLAFATYAQRCGAGVVAISSLSATGAGGFTPDYNSMPCIDSGTYVSDTLYFECYNHVNSDQVVYVKIDSINNLPQGLCWKSNLQGDTLRGGHTGAIYISGTCNAAPDIYKLRFKVSVYNNSISAYSYVKANADTISFDSPMVYYLRVKLPSMGCAPIVLVQPPSAVISPSGSHTICRDSSIRLTASTGTGYTYLWSTGATTRSITVSLAGSYTVTVNQTGGTSAVATPVTIHKDSMTAHFVMVPDTTPHRWLAIDQSVRVSQLLDTRRWYWGDGDSTTFHSFYGHYTHDYTSPGYFNVCIRLRGYLSGCVDVYCDSSTYIYKTNQAEGIASITLLESTDHIAGVNDIDQRQSVRVYPNPASSSLTIEAPDAMPQGAVISDELGQVVREISLPTAKTVFDVKTLPAGVYTLSFPDAAVRSVRFTVTR